MEIKTKSSMIFYVCIFYFLLLQSVSYALNFCYINMCNVMFVNFGKCCKNPRLTIKVFFITYAYILYISDLLGQALVKTKLNYIKHETTLLDAFYE